MIEAKNIFFKYPNTDNFVLKNVSFKIKKGSYVAILGHNGSGKSTLSKLILNTYKPTQGELLIDGLVREKSFSDDFRIGVVFQNPDNQFVGATVEDDIAFGLENRMIEPAEIRKIVLEISKKVDMDKFLQQEPQNLSGGQKQRVAIASTLSLDPQIIVLDEATSMLDPKNKSDFLKIVDDIKAARDKTLVSITHDMDEAFQADWVLVFAQGELIAQGEPKQIFEQKDVLERAKLDTPFLYRVSEVIRGLKPTNDLQKIIRYINDNKKK